MKKITYNNISNKLIEKFPEYRNSPSFFNEEDHSPYTVLGNICLMAFKNIDEREDITLAERLVEFTDKIFNDSIAEIKIIL